MELSPTLQKLILHWGEMGSEWGVNRSVGQIYALLTFTPESLTAEEIAEALSLARSNVSTSIRELQSWGIVKVVSKLGDRREHYEALEDDWETLQRMVEERRKRELDPTVVVLREALVEDGAKDETDTYLRERVADMLRFFETAVVWHEQLQRLRPGTLEKLAAAAEKVVTLVNSASGNGKSKKGEQ